MLIGLTSMMALAWFMFAREASVASRKDVAALDSDSVFARLKVETEALAAMDPSMEFIRAAQAHDIADGVFAAPFIPPKPMLDLLTAHLKQYSYIYRFCPGGLCAPEK